MNVGDAALFRVGSSASAMQTANGGSVNDSTDPSKYDFLLPSLSCSFSKSKSKDEGAWSKGHLAREKELLERNKQNNTAIYADFSKAQSSNFAIDWLGMIPVLAKLKARLAVAGHHAGASEDSQDGENIPRFTLRSTRKLFSSLLILSPPLYGVVISIPQLINTTLTTTTQLQQQQQLLLASQRPCARQRSTAHACQTPRAASSWSFLHSSTLAHTSPTPCRCCSRAAAPPVPRRLGGFRPGR
jgi:hypothetical protein